MNYGEIKKYDIANGEGVRVTLFVSGCTHHCKGCFQPETWNFSYGKLFDDAAKEEILRALNASFINGLTLLGGEPFEPENQRSLLSLLREVRSRYPKKSIWCYTGYTLERDLLSESRARCECTDEMLSMLDVLVDGEFVEELKNISLPFRGSENQRIIDVKKTLEAGKVILWELESDKIHMK
ncbi:MAG: anaerobic ribonucleoside-triphosphate reductase activating protein [Lachnospiraceae bacterium]|nr:anaerobic ribonucleoside-triphosphate reductase activating protein [Lachnospiraceae bacterium]